MWKVRFMPYREGLATIMHRQTKDGKLISQDGRYEFVLDNSLEEADFWVVQGKGIREAQTCRVAKENTILLTTEPRSVLVYPQKYLNQFGLVCTCQQQTRHRNVRFAPAILPWFVGYKPDGHGGYVYSQDLETLSKPSNPVEKTKLISVITSNKAFTRGHLNRIRFVEKLKDYYGEQLDVFGRGFRPFDDKWDVLRPYKYHIAIENSSQLYYWTEKISDCYLTETFPFYYGCTNLADYFPHEAFVPIDIRQPEQAIHVIDSVIAAHRFEQSAVVLSQCKQLVLGPYNMFEYVAGLCDTLNPALPKQQITLLPCHSGMAWENFVNYTFKHNYYKFLTKCHYWKNGNRLKT